MSVIEPEAKTTEETTEEATTEEQTTEVVQAPAGLKDPLPQDAQLTPDEFAEARERKIREAMGVEEPTAEGEETTAVVEPPADPAAETETLEEAQDRAENELPADATQEEIANARREAADEFYLGRYKTREAAEAGVAEKDATILRLHQERDDLKRELEKRGEQVDEKPTELDVAGWTTWAEQQVEEIEDPRQAEALALKALEEGGYQGYEIFLSAWLESEDKSVRARATTFNNAMMLEMSRVRAEAAAAPAIQRNERTDAVNEAREAREKVAARYPDFDTVEARFEEVTARLDAETVDYLTELARQGVDGKARAMDYLYLHARADQVDSRTRAAAEEKKQRAAAADRAKVDATVTTTEAVPTRTTLTETELKARKVVNARRREWGLELLPEE